MPAPARQPSHRAAALARGTEAFARRAWSAAFEQLSAADREMPLPPSDVERLAMTARLSGREADAAELLARAHHGYRRAGNAEHAARCAVWLALDLLYKGDLAQSGGWLARARRLLVSGEHDCVEQGYLLLPAGSRCVMEGDNATAHTTFVQAASIGDRFGDPDLVALSLQGQGRALIRLGDAARGVTLLDEAMIAVTAGEVSPVISGIIYCSVIEACHEIFDLRRAQEWTTALDDWCSSQPELVPYRGSCLIHRAEILQLHGAWPDAVDAALLASERLSQPTAQPGAGAAFYQLAELHRLRGEFGDAEAAYRKASARGRKPQPGLALLRLAEGRIDTAYAAIRRVADEGSAEAARAPVLAAYVEIALAANDTVAARAAGEELASIAARLDAPFLRALAAHAVGAIAVVEGDSRAALAALREAGNGWAELDAPYQAARVRVLVAQACRSLGDTDSAQLEMDAARDAFRRLGAAPDLARTSRPARRAGATGLTARELQVLAQIASGKTNRAIATRLDISEKTVARHVSNIFTKLGLSTRAAATAYAYEHGLARST